MYTVIRKINGAINGVTYEMCDDKVKMSTVSIKRQWSKYLGLNLKTKKNMTTMCGYRCNSVSLKGMLMGLCRDVYVLYIYPHIGYIQI